MKHKIIAFRVDDKLYDLSKAKDKFPKARLMRVLLTLALSGHGFSCDLTDGQIKIRVYLNLEWTKHTRYLTLQGVEELIKKGFNNG